MRKDKARLILMSLVITILFGTILLYGFTVVSKGEMNTGSILPFAITLIITIFMVFFVVRRFRDIKQGMPLEDERSKQVITHAAAKTFYVSLYWLLAISWFEPFFAKTLFQAEKLDAGQTVGGAIGGMAILFFIFWIYYNQKGQLS